MLTIRHATKKDAEEFGPARLSAKASVICEDGKPIGIFGTYFYKGYTFAFSDMKPELRAHKKIMVLAVRIFMDNMAAEKKPLYAIANKDEPTSATLLKHVGFSFVHHSTKGDVYQWLP